MQKLAQNKAGMPGVAGNAWDARDGALRVRVRVSPRGGRDALEGVEQLSDGSAVLKVRVRAAPEDGAANEAVRKLLAKALGCSASAVTLKAGAGARIKTLAIAGDAAALAAVLQRAIGERAV